jgi:hypothetical protein
VRLEQKRKLETGTDLPTGSQNPPTKKEILNAKSQGNQNAAGKNETRAG